MGYLIYVVVKFACYAGWCWVGLRLCRPASATLLGSAGFGLLRLLIGILAGVSIFLAANSSPSCPVLALKALLASIRVNPLAPLFSYDGKRPASRSQFLSRFKKKLTGRVENVESFWPQFQTWRRSVFIRCRLGY